MMRFTLCSGCNISMTLPDDYLSLSPWMYAHTKVCPGKGKLHVVAKVKAPKRKPNGKLSPPSVEADVDAGKFAAQVGKQVAKDMLSAAVDMLFKGKVK